MREATSTKHFKHVNAVFHIIFTMFSMHDQIDVNYLQDYDWSLVT